MTKNIKNIKNISKTYGKLLVYGAQTNSKQNSPNGTDAVINRLYMSKIHSELIENNIDINGVYMNGGYVKLIDDFIILLC